jgi:hypothetical protein
VLPVRGHARHAAMTDLIGSTAVMQFLNSKEKRKIDQETFVFFRSVFFSLDSKASLAANRKMLFRN